MNGTRQMQLPLLMLVVFAISEQLRMQTYKLAAQK